MLLAAGTLLPFLTKPFNIDDVTFLLQAKHLLRDPLHPTAFMMVFHGEPMRLSSGLVSGPVMSALLVPTVLERGAEWIAHLTQLMLLALGVAATAALALRLRLSSFQAFGAALIVAVSPGVLAMAATGMPDVPAMTFGTLGIERLLAWRESRRLSNAVFASLALAAAVFSRPHLLLLLGIGAILLIDEHAWERGWGNAALGLLDKVMWPLLLTGVLLVGVNFLTRDPEAGRQMASTTVARMSLSRFWPNLANVPAQWTLSFPLVIPWLVGRGRAFFKPPAHLVALLAGGCLGLAADSLHGVTVPVVALGTAVLVAILLEAIRRRDRVQLALGLWLLIAVPAAVYAHLPAKYLVPSAPAMAILLMRSLADVAPGRVRGILAASSCVGVLLALLIIRADAALGEIGRRGGEIVAAEVKKGGVVWMDGAWGFQWYAMQAGARPMSNAPPFPAPGDIVVTGPQSSRIDECPRRTLLASERYQAKAGWVLGKGAGFFSNAFGPLPWSWGQGELGRIEVWRIE